MTENTYDVTQTLESTKVRLLRAKAAVNPKMTQDDFVNQLLDIAYASAYALAALHSIENDDGRIPVSIWAMRCEAVEKLEKVMK